MMYRAVFVASVCAAAALSARAGEVCIACEQPAATYRCSVELPTDKYNIAPQLQGEMCAKVLAKKGEHHKCCPAAGCRRRQVRGLGAHRDRHRLSARADTGRRRDLRGRRAREGTAQHARHLGVRDVDVQRLLICKVPQRHRHAIRPRIVDFDTYIAGIGCQREGIHACACFCPLRSSGRRCRRRPGAAVLPRRAPTSPRPRRPPSTRKSGVWRATSSTIRR